MATPFDAASKFLLEAAPEQLQALEAIQTLQELEQRVELALSANSWAELLADSASR